jgi:GTPase SAR1 family protein
VCGGHGVCRCTQIKTYSWDNAQVVLVGNKCDLEDERVVSADRGKQLADQLGTHTANIKSHNTNSRNSNCACYRHCLP